MAITRTSALKVSVDGFPMENLYDVTIEHGTYEDGITFESGALYREKPSNVRAKLTGTDGTTITFRVQGYEQIGDAIHFYGPLRASFPEIFTGIDPIEWQQAYLVSMRRPSLDRFKLRKDDPFFNTELAQTFKLGWEAGQREGAANERKVQTAAKDAVKSRAKADEYNGILGQAFKRRQDT